MSFQLRSSDEPHFYTQKHTMSSVLDHIEFDEIPHDNDDSTVEHAIDGNAEDDPKESE